MRSKRLKRIEDNTHCWYCGDEPHDVDHIIAKSKGGTRDPNNLKACCRPCNNAKRNLTVEEFREFLKERDKKHSTKHTLVKIKPFGFLFYGERNEQNDT